MPIPLTEEQRSARRTQARRAIEAVLRETAHEWTTQECPDYALIADLAMDGLGDLAAEILVDGTMLRGLNVVDGVATLELEPATEILKIFVASMRGCLDGYGAENYLETEMTAPSISMDLRDGDNPEVDSYTVTIQRRTFPGPNLWRPDWGTDTAVFHLRDQDRDHSCTNATWRYKQRWEAEGLNVLNAQPTLPGGES